MLITITSAKAAQRPLAGFGMGACFCASSSVGAALPAAAVPGIGAASGIKTAAAQVLPRPKWAVAAISEGHGPATAGGAGYLASIQTKTEQFNAQQFEHMTRVFPVYQGGVGPHPAREPEPV